jgi:hypothetical protein
MIAIPGLHPANDGYGKVVFGIDARGHSVLDPTVDETRDIPVEPAYYGLTQEQVDFFEKLNDILDKATEAALNAACLAVQEALDVPGETATLFYDGNQQTAPIRESLVHYIISEINLNTGAAKAS